MDCIGLWGEVRINLFGQIDFFAVVAYNIIKTFTLAENNMARNKEIQFEIERDVANRFIAEQYVSKSYTSHFHRNVEIYGVVNGEVVVTIAGEKRVLTSGQIAIVNCMEVHDYAISDQAEIFYFHIGTVYLSIFSSLYKHSLLPHWLMNVEYNKKLYEQIQAILGKSDNFSALKRYGICYNLLSDIVEHYGVMQGGYDNKSHELMEQVVQYIYDHFAEEITLKSLSDRFFVSPKVLSKKLSRCIGVDLRKFVNDIRAQKALQMMDDPEMRGRPQKEIAQLCGFKYAQTFYKTKNRNNALYAENENK